MDIRLPNIKPCWPLIILKIILGEILTNSRSRYESNLLNRSEYIFLYKSANILTLFISPFEFFIIWTNSLDECIILSNNTDIHFNFRFINNSNCLTCKIFLIIFLSGIINSKIDLLNNINSIKSGKKFRVSNSFSLWPKGVEANMCCIIKPNSLKILTISDILQIGLAKSVYGAVKYKTGRFEPYWGDIFIVNGWEIFLFSLFNKSKNKYPFKTLFELYTSIRFANNNGEFVEDCLNLIFNLFCITLITNCIQSIGLNFIAGYNLSKANIISDNFYYFFQSYYKLILLFLLMNPQVLNQYYHLDLVT